MELLDSIINIKYLLFAIVNPRKTEQLIILACLFYRLHVLCFNKFWGGGSVAVDFLFMWESVMSYVLYVLLCVHSSIAIILMGKRELVALLDLSS